MIKGGYQGKLLEVDLSRRETRAVDLPAEAVLRQWVGCSGLGLYLLSQEITPSMKATDPNAPIYVMTGPLTGTPAPQSSNWTIVCLSPMNSSHISASHSHGYWGARLKHAGWDGVIIRGASPTPVYLWIDDDKVEIRDAGHLWGEGSFETMRRLPLELQDEEQISVACIGPAGETLLPGASVRNDKAYGCNKGSTGIAWGAKKLKAIAVRGTGRVPIANYKAFEETSELWRKATMDAQKMGGMPAGLYPFLRDDAGPAGRIPALNYTSGEWGVQFAKRFAEDSASWKITPMGSYNCDLECHHQTTITTGDFAGTTVCGYGSQVIEGSATLIGVEDPGAALAMAAFIDDMCCDPCEPGNAIAMAFEMYNKGLLTKEDTNGLDLTWGNYESFMELFAMMLRREGLGAVLAQGLREAAEALGPEAEKMVVHIQGEGPIQHDFRNWNFLHWCQLAGSIIGLGPTLTASLTECPPEELGLPNVDIEDMDKALPIVGEMAWKTSAKKLWDDCHGSCFFATFWVPGALKYSSDAVAEATGWSSFDRDEALLVGERLPTILRLMSLYRGYDHANDLDISPRALEPVPDGPGVGRGMTMDQMMRVRNDFYAAADWDTQTGLPRPEALEKLGLGAHITGAR